MVPKLLALGPNVELQQYCGNLDEYLVGAGGGAEGRRAAGEAGG